MDQAVINSSPGLYIVYEASNETIWKYDSGTELDSNLSNRLESADHLDPWAITMKDRGGRTDYI